MTPEQESAELAAYKEWRLSDLDDRGNWGISLQGAWLARAEIAAADKARIAALEAEVQALRVDAQRYRWLKSRERHSVTLRDTGANKIVFCYITSRLDSPIDTLMADEKQAAEDFAAIRKAIEARAARAAGGEG